MANVPRIRVELRDKPVRHNSHSHSHSYSSDREGDAQFRVLHSAFKRAVNEEGIIQLWKQKQYHETKGEKRRRKRKEGKLNRIKEENKLKYLGR